MARKFIVSSDDSSRDERRREESSSSESSGKERNREGANHETNLVNIRWKIYLAITSSVDIEEALHKILNIKVEPEQEMELCIMLLECCSQERSYIRYYGHMGQRLCMMNQLYQENFDKCFVQQYSTTIHRLKTTELRNVAKFFAHLIATDALPWHVLANIRLTKEEGINSSSRMFIKILFRELSQHLGIRRLNERLSEPAMQDLFESIFPRDNPNNTRFSIEFFTSIGLGSITEKLRVYLKNMPRLIKQQLKATSESESSNTSDSESDHNFDSESDSKSSDESESRRRRRRI